MGGAFRLVQGLTSAVTCYRLGAVDQIAAALIRRPINYTAANSPLASRVSVAVVNN